MRLAGRHTGSLRRRPLRSSLSCSTLYCFGFAVPTVQPGSFHLRSTTSPRQLHPGHYSYAWIEGCTSSPRLSNMMQQPVNVPGAARPCCSASALKVNIFIWGGLSLVVWGCCIGFTLGYCAYTDLTLYGSLISIPINVGYVYVTCRIIFLISGSTNVTPEVLVDLQRLNARLVALLTAGFSVWVTSVVWFCIYYSSSPYSNTHSSLDNDAYLTFFAANFGFMLSAVVVGLSGGLHDQLKKEVPAMGPGSLQMSESPPKYSASQGPTQVLIDSGVDMIRPAPWPSTSAAYH